MAERRPRYVLAEWMLVIAFCGLVLAFFRSLITGGGSLTSFVLFEIAFLGWFAVWNMVRVKRKARQCEECGRTFVPVKARAIGTDEAAVCPRCRQRALSPAQLKRQQRQGVRALVFVLAIGTAVFGLVLSSPVNARSRRGYWVALPVIAFGATAGLIAAVIIARVAVFQVRYRSLKRESYALAAARESAGVPGEVERSGPITVWSSDGEGPLAVLTDPFERSRARFVALIGEPIEARDPLRILCFGTRGGFLAYHQRFGFEAGNMDGFYAQAPVRTLSLSLEAPPYRLTDLGRLARMLFGYYWLETYKGFPAAYWLKQGVANVVAGTEEGGGFFRLNRRITASLEKGKALRAAELFRIKGGTLAGLVRAWYDHDRSARLAQFNAQAWSLVEYLGGDRATDDRRERFRAFLKGVKAGKTHEQDFERPFGHGYDRLLEDWRDWVRDQGIGTHEPPPVSHRDALLNHVIPTINDPGAKVMDRVQAVRSMGQWGYAMGAEALIGLLRVETEIPREDVVWSLEMISGKALGDDPDRWAAWWESLPPEAVSAGIG